MAEDPETKALNRGMRGCILFAIAAMGMTAAAIYGIALLAAHIASHHH